MNIVVSFSQNPDIPRQTTQEVSLDSHTRPTRDRTLPIRLILEDSRETPMLLMTPKMRRFLERVIMYEPCALPATGWARD
jgi:hypothetical protein